MRTLIMDMGLKVDKHDEIEEESSSGSCSSSGSGKYVNVVSGDNWNVDFGCILMEWIKQRCRMVRNG